MKRYLMGVGTMLVLSLFLSDASAQQRRGGKGAGQGRGAGQSQSQTRPGNQAAINPRQDIRGGGPMGGGPMGGGSGGAINASGSGLDLQRMWEEEKLARDVYNRLAQTSKLMIFRNISRAESQHMQSIERVMRTGAGNGATLQDVPGVFSYPEYQQLYQSLVASGTQNPLAALMVGAKVEEMDIADLRQLLTRTNDAQVRQVLQHLMRGSQNHLRAFASQIAIQGGTYNAEFLTQAEFDQTARGSGTGSGQQGRGQGQQGQGQQGQGQQGSAGFGQGQGQGMPGGVGGAAGQNRPGGGNVGGGNPGKGKQGGGNRGGRR
ncbi:DUF2202 domain-containing protein [Stieleria varia]|uniref:DUF2202 domain-containing protein n=1 Tax=Stieleria varia TaxID=2528005 RepID=A0A5C6BDR5_9BACT|nr:DUF2202 domain-containing protein [Stieleria varia]TWU08574.1 hypothetical protein Pla52n_11570 [Stieleria varia]